MENKNNPSVPSPEYNDLMRKLKLAHTLDGGRESMIAAGETYLPKNGAEEPLDYEARLNKSFLFNMYKLTKSMLTGEVFDKPVTLGDDTPDQIKELADNIDMQGNNLSRFCRGVFHDGIGDGSGFIMVDVPALPRDEEGNEIPTTQADDMALERRPYWVHIPAKNLIGARVSNTNGILKLENVRIFETLNVPDGEFGEEIIEQVRVVYPGRWEIWRETKIKGKKESSWFVVDSGSTPFPDKIPIAGFYSGKKASFWTAEPPLEDLAELTLEHWQSYSDQKNILHYVRVPLLFGNMLETGENGQVIRSPGNMMHSNNASSDSGLKYVEHSGKGVEAGDKDIENIERKARAFGLDMIMNKRTGNITATETALETSKSGSFLNDAALGLQDTINTALGFTAEILKIDPGTVQAKVNTDFAMVMNLTSNEILLKSRMNGDISRETYQTELIRRGELPEGLDLVEEAAKIAKDNMESGSLTTAANTFLQ